MSNKAFADLDSLMDASMDDIDDLPPVGVPPTGHYNLLITASREASQAGSEYIKFSYEVEAVNEVKDAAEESQAAVGMKFTQIFSPFKKDGTVNEYGLGFLKEAWVSHEITTGEKRSGTTTF